MSRAEAISLTKSRVKRKRNKIPGPKREIFAPRARLYLNILTILVYNTSTIYFIVDKHHALHIVDWSILFTVNAIQQIFIINNISECVRYLSSQDGKQEYIVSLLDYVSPNVLFKGCDNLERKYVNGALNSLVLIGIVGSMFMRFSQPRINESIYNIFIQKFTDFQFQSFSDLHLTLINIVPYILAVFIGTQLIYRLEERNNY